MSDTRVKERDGTFTAPWRCIFARCLVALASLTAGCTEGSGAQDTSGGTSDDATSGDAGATWSVEFMATPAEGALMSVWGAGPRDVVVVGGQPPGPSPSSGTVLHYDGQTWETESLPADTPMLNWVYGIDGEIWSVGLQGTILHRSGGSGPGQWTNEVSGTDRTLWGLWGASVDDLWAVGGDGVSDVPVILHRVGGAWTSEDLPAVDPEAHAVFKVWGRSAQDVWFVGDKGLALHWDGQGLSDVSTGDPTDLISVWGEPDGDVLAVGGRANAHFAHHDASGWQTETTVEPGLNGVWVAPDGRAIVVGNQGYLAERPSDVGTFDAVDPLTQMVLHSTYGFDDGSAFAVGGSLLAPPPWLGVILVRR